MRKLYGLKFFVMLTIVLIPVFPGCNAGITNMNGSKTEEIAELSKVVPVYPDKIEINTENYASGSNTSITRKYKSEAPFNRVREFYLEQLKAQGWQLSEERELKDKGRYRGEQVLHFTRGEFLLSVQFAGRRQDVLGWDYAIRIAYPQNWIDKI